MYPGTLKLSSTEISSSEYLSVVRHASLKYLLWDLVDVHMFDASMTSFLILCHLDKWPNVKLIANLSGRN